MPHVQIPDEEASILFAGANGAGPFAFTFSFFAKADLIVRVGGATLAEGAFVLSGNAVEGGFDGGSITLVTPAVAQDVLISRDVRAVRVTDFQNGPITPKDLNTEIDRTVAIGADVKRGFKNAILRSPEEIGDAPIVLPPKTQRADKVFTWDANGAADFTISRVDVATVAAIRTEIEALADPQVVSSILTLSPLDIITALTTLDNYAPELALIGPVAQQIQIIGNAQTVSDLTAIAPHVGSIQTAAQSVGVIATVAGNINNPASNFNLVAGELAPGGLIDLAVAAPALTEADKNAAATSATNAATSATSAGTNATLAQAKASEANDYSIEAQIAADQINARYVGAAPHVYASASAAVADGGIVGQKFFNAQDANKEYYISLVSPPTAALTGNASSAQIAAAQDLVEGRIPTAALSASLTGTIAAASTQKAFSAQYVRSLINSRIARLDDWADFDFTGSADNAASFNTALAQAVAAKAPLHGQTGVIALASKVTLPQGARLIGAGNQTPDWLEELTGAELITSGAAARSTIFHFTHSGVGFDTNSPDGVILENFSTFRTQPDPSAGGSFTPTDHDFDIDLLGAPDSELRRITLINPTRGIRSRSDNVLTSGRHLLVDVDMHPMLIGYECQNSYDVNRLNRVHCWPFWSTHANMKTWMQANLIAFLSRRNDNPEWSQIFSIWHNIGLKIDTVAANGGNSPGGTTYKMRVSDSDFDLGVNGIVLSATVDSATLYFNNVTGEGDTAGGAGLIVSAGAVNSKIRGALSLLNFANNAVRVYGDNNKVRLNDFNGEGCDKASAGFPTVEAGAGNEVHLVGSALLNNAGLNIHTGGGGAVFLPSRKKLSANLTLYVRADGNDKNDGAANTAARAFATRQGAITAAQRLYDKNDFSITVQFEAATTTSPLDVPAGEGGGVLVLRGDDTSFATAANYVVQTTGAEAIRVAPGANVRVVGLTVSTLTAGNGLRVEADARCEIGANTRFAACVNARAYVEGKLYSRAAFEFIGNGSVGLSAVQGGQIDIAATQITFTAAPVFSNGFLVAGRDGHVDAYAITYTNAFTGARFNVGNDSSIFSNGEPETNIPGSAAGIVSATGLFNDRMGDIGPDSVAAAGRVSQVAGKSTPYDLFASGVYTPHTGTTAETTLYTIAVPAGAMGPNGRIEIDGHALLSNTANAKNIRIKFGGVEIMNLNAANGSQVQFRRVVQNRNAANSQANFDAASAGGFGVVATAYSDPAVNTASAQNIVVTAQLANAGESINFLRLAVKLHYGA